MIEFDFVIVGAGPAGCTVAVQLAESPKRPKVLLLELGGKNDGPAMRTPAMRWGDRMNPELNPFYKTVPQTALKDRVIDYDRGKGLGGSSAVNFCVYDIGPRGDFEEIARLVDDDAWHWSNVLPMYKALEHLHDETIPDRFRKFANPRSEDHGKNGKLQLGYTHEWDDVSYYYMELFQKAGYEVNPDLNSGDPIGLGFPALTFHEGWRTMASDLLPAVSENLTIMTDSVVERVLFDGNVATGVQVGNRQYHASKEIILSAGSLDTPKILMHSGVGPADQLQKYGIPILHDLKHIGQNLRDHHHIPLAFQRQEHTTDVPAFWRDLANMAKAQAQWQKDRSGPLSTLGCNYPIGFLKIEDLYQNEEFKALPESEKSHMLQPTVPHYEIAINAPYPGDFVDPLNAVAVVCLYVFFMNLQSRGEITLQSPKFSDPLLFNPRSLSHPFDQRLAIESVKKTLKTCLEPPLSDDTIRPLEAPASLSDEDIWNYVQDTAGSTWHMTGTVKMGRPDDETACVDREFCVRGVQRLRVVDMSIFPILPNNHTQTSAYIAGAIAASKLIDQYQLA